MSNVTKPLSYAHLHAYADQELIDQRRVDVADFVKTHPNIIIHVRDYQLINQKLHELFDVVLNEPVPERLLKVLKQHSARRRKWTSKLFIILVGMVLGGIIGVVLHTSRHLDLITNVKDLLESLISRVM